MPIATTTNVKTLSGNRAVVEFGGTQIGLVQSVRLNDNYGLEDATQIGDINVVEHVPTKATHIVSVSNMVLFVGNMRQAGVAPVNGKMVLQGVVLDIVVYSKDTGLPLRSYKSCSYDSGTTTVEANRIMMQEGTLKALTVTGTGI